jgi:hypothetical protein
MNICAILLLVAVTAAMASLESTTIGISGMVPMQESKKASPSARNEHPHRLFNNLKRLAQRAATN